MHLVLSTYEKIRQHVESEGSLIVGPAFMELLIEANRMYLKQFNVSYEIAKYFHETRQFSKSSLPQVLLYNLDRDRFEGELRKYLLCRYIDQNNYKSV